MMAGTETSARRSVQPLLRFLTLVVGAASALLWLPVAYLSVADALPLAKGVRLGLYSTLLFLGFAWPALILAICNLATRIAFMLALLAATAYAAIYVAYLPPPSGPLPVLLIGLVVIVLGTYWLFGPVGGPERAFENVKSRLVVLYVAGLGTVTWLSGFAYPIEIWSRGRGDGFEILPAFYGTIFYLALVLPLKVIGLAGAEQRYETATRTLLVLTTAVALIFGVPQLFR